MKSRTLILAMATPLLLTAATATRLAAQEHNNKHHHYILNDVGTFGGPSSWMTNPAVVRLGLVNNQRMLTGEADTSDVDPSAGGRQVVMPRTDSSGRTV